MPFNKWLKSGQSKSQEAQGDERDVIPSRRSQRAATNRSRPERSGDGVGLRRTSSKTQTRDEKPTAKKDQGNKQPKQTEKDVTTNSKKISKIKQTLGRLMGRMRKEKRMRQTDPPVALKPARGRMLLD
ncbi:MAG: hypothetical protein ASARMPRED_003788 [Alectoria sarmentosa]|nr:MAG: hypothetical protein ASARMPRED_003788 [Alectoria sarmentosa]